MPTCGAMNISADTDVIVIESHDSRGQTNVLLGAKKHSAELINIVIGEVERPITIVVSQYDAAVLNFTGDVDQVDQLIALGSRKLGWDQVAVTGLDTRKLTFLPIVGYDRNLVTSCSAPPKSCIPQQYFDLTDEGRSWIGEMPINPKYKRMQPTIQIGALGKNTVHIPPKSTPSTDPSAVAASDLKEFKWPKDWREEVDWYNKSTDGVTAFSRDQLLSPSLISFDHNLPSWAGIMGLVEEGVIRPAGDYDTDRDLIGFSNAFNEKYRTRFDPDFSFEPSVDFVLRHHFRGELPRDLRKADRTAVTFLRTYSRMPQRSEGDTGKYCFFEKGAQLVRPKSTSDNEHWRSLCKSSDLGRTRGRLPSLAALQLGAAESLENHRQWNTQLCPLIDIPTEAEVIVLSTQHGRIGNGIEFRQCDIETSQQTVSSGDHGEILGAGSDQCVAGEVDVKIDHSGPAFLFLKGNGSIKWQFDISDTSEIAGVVTVNDQRQMVTGLPGGVPFNQYTASGPSLPDDCRNNLLNASPLAGGPAIRLFEMMLNQTSGRKIDHLFNKGISPDQESLNSEKILDYTTFVIQ